MQEPQLVADCLQAMSEAAVDAEITVKCRIGVDKQNPAENLPEFVEMVSTRGIETFTIHARMAWLQGLSPKENRHIPPLDYELVHQVKSDFPDLEIVINGGINSLDQALEHINRGLDGAMIGRAAYHHPAAVLSAADRRLFGATYDTSARQAVRDMLPYIEDHLIKGGRLNHITRHMLGLFSGQPGARNWRRVLSENSHLPGAGPEVVLQALAQVADLPEKLAV